MLLGFLSPQFNFFSSSQAPDFSMFTSEEAVQENHEELYNKISAYLKSQGYVLADICLEYLRDKKKGEFRKDNITPDYIHELRQVSAAIMAIENGLVPKNSELGSAELLVCACLVHDLGEDFNISFQELYNHLVITLRHNSLENDENVDKALRVSQIMELMTMDRVYEIPESETDDEFKTRIIKKLSPFEIAVPDPVIRIEDEDGVRKATVSRCDLEWNAYIDMMQRDPFAILAKFLDRNEGLSTRIGIGSLTGYDRYLDRTELAFSRRDTSADMQRKYPALERAFEYFDAMTGTLYAIGRDYVGHHPERYGDGAKRFDASYAGHLRLRTLSEGIRAYSGLPAGLDPLKIIAGRINKEANEANDEVKSGLANLRDKIMSSIEYYTQSATRRWAIRKFPDIEPYLPKMRYKIS